MKRALAIVLIGVIACRGRSVAVKQPPATKPAVRTASTSTRDQTLLLIEQAGPETTADELSQSCHDVGGELSAHQRLKCADAHMQSARAAIERRQHDRARDLLMSAETAGAPLADVRALRKKLPGYAAPPAPTDLESTASVAYTAAVPAQLKTRGALLFESRASVTSCFAELLSDPDAGFAACEDDAKAIIPAGARLKLLKTYTPEYVAHVRVLDGPFKGSTGYLHEVWIQPSPWTGR